MNQQEFDDFTRQSEGTISAKVICDSVAPNGCRLTTMEWTYPRCIHSEIMTHRKLSRNAASSRAIPLQKMIERVRDKPFFPIHWGKNQKGMQADQELNKDEKLSAAMEWLEQRTAAVYAAKRLEQIGIHKQIGNRILEPWMWITVIVSATNFENLFALRCNSMAEPHFQNLAFKIRAAYDGSKPVMLEWEEWHLPYITVEEDDSIPEVDLPKISAARCARVSYLTQDGKRDPQQDIELYNRLSDSVPLHASPLEHPAQAKEVACDWGNFDPGFLQFRKMHVNENILMRMEL